MSVMAQLPKEMGGAEGKVAYIDTEGTFRPERIAQIAERLGVDPESAQENIAYARALNSEHQLELLNTLSKEFTSGQYRLLIIDSIMNCFRVDYCGRGELADRQQKLNQFLMKLAHMAEEFNICVLMAGLHSMLRVALEADVLFRLIKSKATLEQVLSSQAPMVGNLSAAIFWLMHLPRGCFFERAEAMSVLPKYRILQIARSAKQHISSPMAALLIPKRLDSSLWPERQAAVKKEFIHAWKGYRKHGWMSDEFRPLTAGAENKFCGWSATLIDALDTLYIMGLKDEFEDAVKATTKVDFTKSDNSCTVNLFETVIRHLGGLIAAYDLSGHKSLIPKMKELGDMLFAAFGTYNGIPMPHWSPSMVDSQGYQPPSDIAMAALGSLNMEFTRLSSILEDDRYAIGVHKVTEAFEKAQMNNTMPGMWPEIVDSTGNEPFNNTISNSYSLGALSDSTYEYLVKVGGFFYRFTLLYSIAQSIKTLRANLPLDKPQGMSQSIPSLTQVKGHLLMGTTHPIYATMWHRTAAAVRKHFIFRPMTPSSADILFTGKVTADGFNPPTLTPEVQHLACFQGGMFALASRLFSNPDDMALAEKLTLGCAWSYEVTATGIGPETFHVIACESADYCEWNQTLWDERSSHLSTSSGKAPPPAGILRISDGRYLLRPEAIESIFVLYRLTGRNSYREIGWKMFERIRALTRTEHAHAAIENVLNEPDEKGKVQLRDEMESFWLAETLKYFWLLFGDPEEISLDDYVLNTEAHPFRLVEGQRGI
ncbi:MAG: hypothetical protein Q9227_000368 [Pyrenula ochraceoflavens]